MIALAAALVATAGFVHFADQGKSSSRKTTRRAARTNESSAAHRASHLGQMNLRIAYGSTPDQVLREIGSPTRVESGCWLYAGRVGRIRGRYSGSYVDAMKFCFGAGPTGGKVMTRILSHTVRHTIVNRDPLTHKITSKRTYQAGWGDPITIIQPPAWYLQQSS